MRQYKISTPFFRKVSKHVLGEHYRCTVVTHLSLRGAKRRGNLLPSASTAEMEGFDSIKVSFPSSRERARLPRSLAFNLFKSLISFSPKEDHPVGGPLLAEMEGFEPPHALRRLADFESAPFSHLGTSPYWQQWHYISESKKNQGFFASSITSPIFSQIAP